jgi:hypothetical protein
VGEWDVFELVDPVKMVVDEGLVDEGPEVFCRLQLGRVGWKEVQIEVVGHAEAQAAVPAGSVHHQHDLLLRTCSHLACEGRQFRLEEGMLTAVAR